MNSGFKLKYTKGLHFLYCFVIIGIIVGIRIVKVRKINVIAKGLEDWFFHVKMQFCARYGLFSIKVHTIIMFFVLPCAHMYT